MIINFENNLNFFLHFLLIKFLKNKAKDLFWDTWDVDHYNYIMIKDLSIYK